jgi:hypothetical protein
MPTRLSVLSGAAGTLLLWPTEQAESLTAVRNHLKVGRTSGRIPKPKTSGSAEFYEPLTNKRFATSLSAIPSYRTARFSERTITTFFDVCGALAWSPTSDMPLYYNWAIAEPLPVSAGSSAQTATSQAPVTAFQSPAGIRAPRRRLSGGVPEIQIPAVVPAAKRVKRTVAGSVVILEGAAHIESVLPSAVLPAKQASGTAASRGAATASDHSSLQRDFLSLNSEKDRLEKEVAALRRSQREMSDSVRTVSLAHAASLAQLHQELAEAKLAHAASVAQLQQDAAQANIRLADREERLNAIAQSMRRAGSFVSEMQTAEENARLRIMNEEASISRTLMYMARSTFQMNKRDPPLPRYVTEIDPPPRRCSDLHNESD